MPRPPLSAEDLPTIDSAAHQRTTTARAHCDAIVTHVAHCGGARMPTRTGLIGLVVATVIALGVAGCSPTPTEEDGQRRGASDAAAPTESPGGTQQGQPNTAGSTGADQSTPPNGAPATMSRDALLDALWEIADLEGERPEVELVREIGDEDWSAVQTECLTEAGFPPSVDSAEAVGWEVPAEQADAFALADYTCQAQYPRKME